MIIKHQENPPIFAADMPPETQTEKGAVNNVSRPPHSTTLPPLRRHNSLQQRYLQNTHLSPAAMLSPDVLTRRKRCRRNAASVRCLVLHRVGECLYRSDAGIYYAVLKIKGKQVRRSLGTADKSIARKKLVELRRLSSRLTPAAITFEHLTQQYLDFYRGQVTKECSSRSFNVNLETLKQIFNYASEHGFILDNPAAAIKRQRQKKAEVVIPTKNQFRLLIDDLRLGQQTQDAADFVEF